MSNDLFAGIEAGGTKIICAIAEAEGKILEQTRIATGEPDANFEAIAEFYEKQFRKYGPVRAGGIASFGPLDLDRNSKFYGHLTTTPKPGWASINMLERLGNILNAPTVIDTDVNCAALAEARYGVGRGLERLCYVTVGTGIGVGIVDQGKIYSGAGHPEVGHIRISRALGDDFSGICPSHGDCAEGLACGPAMKARWHKSAEDLPADHIAWVYEAHYIAALCVNLTYILRPQRIIIGGGVLERSSLYGGIRKAFGAMMAGYAPDRYNIDPETFISAPYLYNPSPGLVGAIELARSASASSMMDYHA